MLCFWFDVLDNINLTSKLVQHKNATVAMTRDELLRLKTFFENCRSEEKFSMYENKAEVMFQQLNEERTRKKARSLRAVYFEVLDNFPTEIQTFLVLNYLKK